MRGMVYVGEGGFGEDDDTVWIERGLACARTLTPKWRIEPR